MRTPKLLKIYFYLNRAEEGKHTPTDEDLKEAFKYPPLTGEFSEVPGDRSDIRDYDGMTTNKQFWWTKVHASGCGSIALRVIWGFSSMNS